MKKLIKKILRIRRYKAMNHSGLGFTQGTGFNIETEKLDILGLTFVTGIKVDVNQEWIRDLKNRIKKDDEQQKRELK